MGETTGTTTTAEPQTTAAAVAAAALKGQDEAETRSEEVVSKPKTIEALIAERTAKRVQKKVAEQQLAEGHRRAGDVLLESRNYKAAVAQYQEALNLCRNNVKYYLCLATAYRKLTWYVYEEAAHNATQALILDPKNTEARYIRGVARLEQRLLNPAKLDFEVVLQHDPTHFLARAALTEVSAFIAASTQLGNHQLEPNPVDELTKDVDFGFPHLDYEPLEIASVSDSSDCNHVGNGVPCRFYNHDGCARGNLCTFSHAPDEKSVRDELGRNVCIYHLLDSCKFGPGRCVYSHSKLALPKRGWWTSPEKIAKVKAVMEVTEKKAKEARHNEAEQWKAYIKSVKAQRPPKSARNPNGNAHANGHGNGDTNPNVHSTTSAKGGAPHTEKAQPKKAGQGKKPKTEAKVQGKQDDTLSQVANGKAHPQEEEGFKAAAPKPVAKEAAVVASISAPQVSTSVADHLNAYYAIKPTSAAEYLNAYYKVVV
ncbi:hypothetical protein BJ165DRAFT_1357201 [Panaeolus papilionaceus]|nr:hypothetical protein BJ165DRAFT_1357201 [Panaeolus papilionaceus]